MFLGKVAPPELETVSNTQSGEAAISFPVAAWIAELPLSGRGATGKNRDRLVLDYQLYCYNREYEFQKLIVLQIKNTKAVVQYFSAGQRKST